MNCAEMYDMNCERNDHYTRVKYHVQILVVLKVWQTQIKRLSYFMVAKTEPQRHIGKLPKIALYIFLK